MNKGVVLFGEGSQEVEAEEQSEQQQDKLQSKIEQNCIRHLKRKVADVALKVDHIQREVKRLAYLRAYPPIKPSSELTSEDKQELEAQHMKRIQDILCKHCGHVMRDIMKHKWAWVFNKPVDTSKYTDYLKIIKEPMDFGSIKSKLEKGKYCTVEQFLYDANLVFSNAKTYNPSGTDVYFMTQTIEDKFKEKYAGIVIPKLSNEEKVREQERAEFPLTKYRRSLQQHHHKVDDTCIKLKCYIEGGLNREIQLNGKGVAAYSCKQLSAEERTSLSKSLQSLHPALQAGAKKIVQATRGSGTQLDFWYDPDKQDSLILRQLQWYNRECVKAVAEEEIAHSNAQNICQKVLSQWPALNLFSGLTDHIQTPPVTFNQQHLLLAQESGIIAQGCALLDPTASSTSQLNTQQQVNSCISEEQVQKQKTEEQDENLEDQEQNLENLDQKQGDDILTEKQVFKKLDDTTSNSLVIEMHDEPPSEPDNNQEVIQRAG